jgi:hypothetical protein
MFQFQMKNLRVQKIFDLLYTRSDPKRPVILHGSAQREFQSLQLPVY